jgi:uncharacterized membrane protein
MKEGSMAFVSESIIIACPVETVFAFAGDYRNDPQWRTGVREMTVTPDTDIELGTITREVLHFAGKVYVTERNVVTWKPNQQASFKSFAAAFPLQGDRHFEPDGTDTRFTYTLTISAESFVDKLMKPVLVRMFRSQMRKDLKTLKVLLERTNPYPATSAVNHLPDHLEYLSEN